jgi:hypothetical protein
VVREESIITVTVEMMRDGPEDTQVVSKTEVIEVGQDQNGKVLTSLVVTPSEAPGRDTHGGWPRSLSMFHAATKSAIASDGEHFQPEPGVVAVSATDLEHIRDDFYATYAEAEEDEAKRQEKIRKAFNRALGEAQRRGLIKVRRITNGPCKGQTMIWLPSYGEDA